MFSCLRENIKTYEALSKQRERPEFLKILVVSNVREPSAAGFCYGDSHSNSKQRAGNQADDVAT
jgi:hypothetical protein